MIRSSLSPSALYRRTSTGIVEWVSTFRVRTLDVLPLPAPIPLRSRLDFGRRVPWHALPIGPPCTGLHLLLQRASSFFPTRPHGARPDCLAMPPPVCSCLRLAVASNLLRGGLAPPIQCPCLAHQGRPLGHPALRGGLDRRALFILMGEALRCGCDFKSGRYEEPRLLSRFFSAGSRADARFQPSSE